MAITIVTSADVGAPSLTNAAGSMITLLDYLLVMKSGWTKAFAGTNKAAYKQPAGTNGFYLRCEDIGTTYNSPKVASYETMSDVDTGTNPFPNGTTQTFSTFLKNTGATPTYWYFITNGKFFYLMVGVGATTTALAGSGSLVGFGDITSIVPNDAYATVLLANASSGGTDSSSGGMKLSSNWFIAAPSYVADNYITRSFTQVGTARPIAKFVDSHLGGGVTSIGNGNLPYPDATGAMRMSRVHIAESGVVRGDLPGLYSTNHGNLSLLPAVGWVDFVGSGDTAGKTFRHFVMSSCSVTFETSDTWI